MKKLIIWDFDGVIADSEKLWVKVWCDVLAETKGIKLSDKMVQEYLPGVADRTRKQRIENLFPDVELDDVFMNEISKREVFAGMHEMQAIPGVEDVMADQNFAQCIATGATKEQHAWKMTLFRWIEKYIAPKDFYTVDMVAQGKPDPDLFLLAADSKGYKPKDCVVIGDSLNDILAAKAAKMDCIAFVGAEGNNTEDYKEKCLSAGAITVCETMKEVHEFLNKKQ